jgi:transcriptional regulator with XRE-family HTH domain/tetratricopeptide (TPR) repeat protein
MGNLSPLAQARIVRGLTQPQVAEHAEVDTATVCRWEKGVNHPYPRHVKKLCDLFGKTAQELGLIPFEPEEIVPPAVAVESRPRESGSTIAFTKFFQNDLELRLQCLISDWLSYRKSTDTCAVLQYQLSLQLEGSMFMNEQQPQQNREGVDRARRDALRRMALVPIHVLGLGVLGAAPPRAPEEVLSHCAAGITACHYLAKGQHEDLALAFSVLSTYLSPLKRIVDESSLYRKEASRLVGQALNIQSVLSVHREGAKRAANYARQAVIYSKESGDLSLQLMILQRLAWIYSCDKQSKQALGTALQAKYILESASLPVLPLIQSAVYGTVAKYQAQNRQQEEAFTALGVAHETFAVPAEDEERSGIDPDYNLSNLILRDGLTHYYLGHYDEALDSFAKAIDLETLDPKVSASSERVRIELINHQVLASLKSSKREKGHSIYLWKAGMQGAIALRSEQRFIEALTAYDIMEALWSDDKRITELRDLILHW